MYPEIRIAQAADINQLGELLGDLFRQEADFSPDESLQRKGLSAIIGNPELGIIFVLEESQLIIGMVNLLFSISTALGGKVAILEDMIVRPEYRKKGYGSLLINQAIVFAKNNGFQRITLLTDQNNLAAQSFYESFGFAKSAMIPMRLLFSAD